MEVTWREWRVSHSWECSPNQIKARLWECGVWISSKICTCGARQNSDWGFEGVSWGSQNIAGMCTAN